MEVVGLLKVKYDMVNVSSKFSKRDFVATLDFDAQYPQHVLFQLNQQHCLELDKIEVGDMIKVYFNLNGREWNGPQGIKYFNTLTAWKVEVVSKSNAVPVTTQQPTVTNTPVQAQTQSVVDQAMSNTNKDDLPF